MSPKTFETWLVFHNAIKYLDRGSIQSLYTQSTRHFYRWAGDPKYSASVQRNPIDRLKMLFVALDDAGKGGVARAAVDYLARAVGGRFCDVPGAKSKTGDVNEEIADIAIAAGRLTEFIREAVKDGELDTAERIRTLEAARSLKREVGELLDAAGLQE